MSERKKNASAEHKGIKKPDGDRPQDASGPEGTCPGSVSRETSAGDGGKSGGGGGGKPPQRTAPVFAYLVILFAAAFLMLLLAYFVQQRSNADAIDNLRTTMTATREELMAENQALEEENQRLEAEKQALQAEKETREEENQALQQQIGELEEEVKLVREVKDQTERQAITIYELWRAEELFEEKDYEASAQVLRELFAHGSGNSVGQLFGDGELSLQVKALQLVKELNKLGHLDVADIDPSLICTGATEWGDILDRIEE